MQAPENQMIRFSVAVAITLEDLKELDIPVNPQLQKDIVFFESFSSICPAENYGAIPTPLQAVPRCDHTD